MNCPTRRNGGPYARPTGGNCLSGDGTGLASYYPLTLAARGDYAANVGDEHEFDQRCQSISPNQYNTVVPGFPPHLDTYSGISFCGTAVKLRQITDGLSKTIALGERWIPVTTYESNLTWVADDFALFVGFQDDTVRSTYYDGKTPTHVPIHDAVDPTSIPGVTGSGDEIPRELFGSAHQGGCLFSLCDGSVNMVAYDVDPEIFRQMGDRRDGGVTKVFKRRTGS